MNCSLRLLERDMFRDESMPPDPDIMTLLLLLVLDSPLESATNGVELLRGV